MKHIAFIGAGNMGGALVRGACKALDPQEVLIYEPSQKAAAALSAETGCQVAASGAQAVREARYVMPVSYTHLDVYKRQDPYRSMSLWVTCSGPAAAFSLFINTSNPLLVRTDAHRALLIRNLQALPGTLPDTHPVRSRQRRPGDVLPGNALLQEPGHNPQLLLRPWPVKLSHAPQGPHPM